MGAGEVMATMVPMCHHRCTKCIGCSDGPPPTSNARPHTVADGGSCGVTRLASSNGGPRRACLWRIGRLHPAWMAACLPFPPLCSCRMRTIPARNRPTAGGVFLAVPPYGPASGCCTAPQHLPQSFGNSKPLRTCWHNTCAAARRRLALSRLAPCGARVLPALL